MKKINTLPQKGSKFVGEREMYHPNSKYIKLVNINALKGRDDHGGKESL